MVPIAIYGLIFWDVIYNDQIKDVFHSPYQPFPLDINFDDFYPQRCSLIEEMLVNLRFRWSINDACEIMEKNWNENYEKLSVVNWSVFESVEDVKVR